jgi:hypothetical protein
MRCVFCTSCKRCTLSMNTSHRSRMPVPTSRATTNVDRRPLNSCSVLIFTCVEQRELPCLSSYTGSELRTAEEGGEVELGVCWCEGRRGTHLMRLGFLVVHSKQPLYP